jgi:hypothetical protein
MEFCQGLQLFISLFVPVAMAVRAPVARSAEGDGRWTLGSSRRVLSLRSPPLAQATG